MYLGGTNFRLMTQMVFGIVSVQYGTHTTVAGVSES